MGAASPRGLGGGRGRRSGRALTESPWPRWERRAIELARRYPHASEPLRFYVEVLRAQEPLAFHARIPEWLDLVHEPDRPRLRLERLPIGELTDDLGTFIEDLASAATPVLAAVGKKLDDLELRKSVLEIVLANGSWKRLSADLGFGEPELTFFPWAFSQPIAHGLGVLAARRHDEAAGDRHGAAEAGGPDPAGAPSPTCPTCGRPPLSGVLQDEPDHQGRRRLVCSLCWNAWPFPRLTCAACLETAADKLEHHVSEAWPHVRVDACRSCETYQKTIDLRTAGEAIPVVDELASLELDLWADERGLRKLERNLLGL